MIGVEVAEVEEADDPLVGLMNIQRQMVQTHLRSSRSFF